VPRFSDGGLGGGIRVPGLYEALLVKERRRCREPDPRNILSDQPGDMSPVFHRSRRLLDALEAGKPVVLPWWMVGSPRSQPPVVLPWDRQEVPSLLVSPDDVVRPAESSGHWPGCAADDVEVVGR
jgi:hypothetical protein